LKTSDCEILQKTEDLPFSEIKTVKVT